jgi:hypothetical protein
MKTQKTECAFLLISRKANVPNQESQPDHAVQQKINRLYLQDITTSKQITLCVDASGTGRGTIILLDEILKQIKLLKKQKIVVTDIVVPSLCRIGRNFTMVNSFQAYIRKLNINIHVAEPLPVPNQRVLEFMKELKPINRKQNGR